MRIIRMGKEHNMKCIEPEHEQKNNVHDYNFMLIFNWNEVPNKEENRLEKQTSSRKKSEANVKKVDKEKNR